MKWDVFQNDFFTNMEFLDIGCEVDEFDWSKVIIQYKNVDGYYYYRAREEVTRQYLKGMFNGNRLWILKVKNIETTFNRFFIFVWDRHKKRMYVHDVEERVVKAKDKPKELRRILENISINFLRACGEDIPTKEDKVIKYIMDLFSFEGEVIDTRNKILDEKVQKITLRNDRTKKLWKEFFEKIGVENKNLKSGLRYYPDLIVETNELNRRGNKKKIIIELELGMHQKQDFFAKMRKAHKSGCEVYFIFDDYWLTYHYYLVEEFLYNKYVKKFNSLKYCTISEFYENGTLAFRDF